MLGLAVLFFVVMYFVILIFLTIIAYVIVKKRINRKWAVRVALVVFLSITLPVFWDWIPTKLAHEYYCKNEAGFFQYKTLEQWKAENPGVWETLRPYSRKESQTIGNKESIFNGQKYSGYMENERFIIYGRGGKIPFLPIRRSEGLFVDDKTQEIIAKSVDFRTGPGNKLALGANTLADYKMWLNQKTCGDIFAINTIKRQFINQSLKQEGIQYD